MADPVAKTSLSVKSGETYTVKLSSTASTPTYNIILDGVVKARVPVGQPLLIGGEGGATFVFDQRSSANTGSGWIVITPQSAKEAAQPNLPKMLSIVSTALTPVTVRGGAVDVVKGTVLIDVPQLQGKLVTIGDSGKHLSIRPNEYVLKENKPGAADFNKNYPSGALILKLGGETYVVRQEAFAGFLNSADIALSPGGGSMSDQPNNTLVFTVNGKTPEESKMHVLAAGRQSSDLLAKTFDSEKVNEARQAMQRYNALILDIQKDPSKAKNPEVRAASSEYTSAISALQSAHAATGNAYYQANLQVLQSTSYPIYDYSGALNQYMQYLNIQRNLANVTGEEQKKAATVKQKWSDYQRTVREKEPEVLELAQKIMTTGQELEAYDQRYGLHKAYQKLKPAIADEGNVHVPSTALAVSALPGLDGLIAARRHAVLLVDKSIRTDLMDGPLKAFIDDHQTIRGALVTLPAKAEAMIDGEGRVSAKGVAEFHEAIRDAQQIIKIAGKANPDDVSKITAVLQMLHDKVNTTPAFADAKENNTLPSQRKTVMIDLEKALTDTIPFGEMKDFIEANPAIQGALRDLSKKATGVVDDDGAASASRVRELHEAMKSTSDVMKIAGKKDPKNTAHLLELLEKWKETLDKVPGLSSKEEVNKMMKLIDGANIVPLAHLPGRDIREIETLRQAVGAVLAV